MNKETIEKLKTEVRLGERAKVAYEDYLRNFIDVRKNDLYLKFIKCESDTEKLLALKRSHDVLLELETSVINDIQTGMLAGKQLTEGK